jgi:predicted glutamine amidotransferase
MCRIFGFRSVLIGKVHTSLATAENALAVQSDRNPDGWGVAYYVDDSPHLIKSPNTAITDDLFKKISEIVTSQTVLAHVRKATSGGLNLLNTHPFQYGKWAFAHNGNIRNFQQHRAQLITLIHPKLRNYIMGETDSEYLFYIFLSSILNVQKLSGPILELKIVVNQIENAIQEIINIIGPLNHHEKDTPQDNYLTFILSDGKMLVGMQGGQPLHYSTHKTKCPERDECGFFNSSCEQKSQINQEINHLILSSEPLQGQNVWQSMKLGDLVAVDEKMTFLKTKIKIPEKA